MCDCKRERGVVCSGHALRDSGMSAKAFLEEHEQPEPVKPDCEYCDGYCVHDVAGAEESGLRFGWNSLVSLPGNYEDLMTPEGLLRVERWTRFEWRQTQPKELAVYSNGRWLSGPTGGRSERTARRTGNYGTQRVPTKRSQAGALLSALKRLETSE